MRTRRPGRTGALVALTVAAGLLAVAPESWASPAAGSSPFLVRVAVGAHASVRVGSATWARDTVGRGGQVIGLRGSGKAAALVGHARLGSSVYTFTVPTAGVYRVTAVLGAGGSGSAALLAQGQTLVGTVRPSRTASYAAGSVAVTNTRRLTVAVKGGRLPVSGVQVSWVRPLPFVATGVTARIVAPVGTVAAFPAVGTPPTGEPASPHWLSGVWPGGTSSTVSAEQFGIFRQQAVGVVSTSNPRGTWADIADNMIGVDAYAGFPGRLSIDLPMLPPDGSTLQQVAAGAHDAEFQAFGANLVARGRGNSFLLVGWEFNGDWQPWAAYDAEAFKAAFRRIVLDVRSTDPQAVIVYDGNFGTSQVGHSPFTDLYPGDSYVDVIGVDAYNRKWFAVHDAASWQNYLNTDGGLNQWLAFAKSRHKKLAFPEWALYGSETGDMPFYIQQMHGFFAANASSLAYECYFNDSESFVGADLVFPGHNPRSANLYAALFH